MSGELIGNTPCGAPPSWSPTPVRVPKAKDCCFYPGWSLNMPRMKVSFPSGEHTAALPLPRPAEQAGPTFVSNFPERSGGASRLPLGSLTPHRSSPAPSRPRSARPCAASPVLPGQAPANTLRGAERGGDQQDPSEGLCWGAGLSKGGLVARVNP